MTFEVEIRCLAKQFRTEQVGLHSDDLGTLLVDSQCVEVIDLHIGIGAHRVRHRTRILCKLVRTQHAHILDAFHASRSHVSRKLLVPEDGEALFKAELEPVTASDPVACPVMEILMRDDAFNCLVVGVCSGLRQREQQLGVEDVEPLVFHGAHVEVVDCHDHEDIEIVLATIGHFVPAHRFLERTHGIAALVDVFRL